MKKYKSILITLLVLISVETYSQSSIQKIEFHLECKVSDQIVFEIEDGKSKRYAGYKDGLKLGDKFFIKFSVKHDVETTYNIHIKSDELKILTDFISTNVTTYPKLYAFKKGSIGFVGNLSSNSIYLDGLFSKVSMKRYFKNDWELMSTSTVDTDSTWMLTANCMNMPSEFDEMLKIVENVSGKLNG